MDGCTALLRCAAQEEIKDLLLPSSPGAARPSISIRETQGGGVGLYGAAEREVRSREELATVLEVGTLCRSTASTSMNNRWARRGPGGVGGWGRGGYASGQGQRACTVPLGEARKRLQRHM